MPLSDKAKRKIARARFPRARKAWEKVKNKVPNVAAGGAGGAAAGAALGKYFPVVGPAIGAAVGGVGGALAGGLHEGNVGKEIKEGIFGTDVEQAPTVTPEQQNILKYLQDLGVQGLQNPYAGFAPIAQQAQNQFYQETVPSLAHRFTSLGNASLSSPSFASAVGGAGANLQTDLAALQSGYGQQNIGQILQMLQLGLQPQFQNMPGQPGLFPQLLSNAGNLYQGYQTQQLLKQLA